jgi:hypothetical protein
MSNTSVYKPIFFEVAEVYIAPYNPDILLDNNKGFGRNFGRNFGVGGNPQGLNKADYLGAGSASLSFEVRQEQYIRGTGTNDKPNKPVIQSIKLNMDLDNWATQILAKFLNTTDYVIPASTFQRDLTQNEFNIDDFIILSGVPSSITITDDILTLVKDVDFYVVKNKIHFIRYVLFTNTPKVLYTTNSTVTKNIVSLNNEQDNTFHAIYIVGECQDRFVTYFFPKVSLSIIEQEMPLLEATLLNYKVTGEIYGLKHNGSLVPFVILQE